MSQLLATKESAPKAPLAERRTRSATAPRPEPQPDGADAVRDKDPSTPDSHDPTGPALDHVLRLVERLNRAYTLEERIAIYQEAGRARLFAAAGRFPELMPTVNDEFEWIVATLE